MPIKKTVDEWLDEVNYYEFNHGNYQPSEFALKYVNFIKLVNGVEGEANKTPVMHLKMLDQIAGSKENIANLCFRGAAKTTLMGEYFIPYIGVFGGVDGFGSIDGMIYVSDSMENGVASLRKNLEYRYYNSEFLQEWLPKAKFTEKYFEFENKEGHRLGVKLFGAKTGLRGTKIFGKRPVLAILDDLVSDDDARSKTAMESIKDTVYKGIDYALDPNRKKVIFNGTPFNQEDVLYEAVESGAWHVNVYPVCEKFPCAKEEFNGAWEDRFTFESVNKAYEKNKAAGKLAAFYQELMLRISNGEDRLIQDEDIRWYNYNDLIVRKHNYNFYITTDFATSDKQSSDYSVIAVWAVNYNGDYFLVDGICKRQTMDKNINDLFDMCQLYLPQSVGVEITGQQGAFIQWIQEEQIKRNIFFSLAKEKGKTHVGIRPIVNKLSRFNLIVPTFSAGKVYFPKDRKHMFLIKEFINEIRMATSTGLKGKDDCLDTASMLMFMRITLPSKDEVIEHSREEHTSFWGDRFKKSDDELDGFSSYTV